MYINGVEVIDIAVKDIVEMLIQDRKENGQRITKTAVADYLGISRQNLVNKFSRDTFSPEELSKIAELFGCDLVIRDEEKEYKITY